MLPIAISYDHRVIDGAAAARFTVDLVQAFENFKEEDVKILERILPHSILTWNRLKLKS